MTKIEGKKRLAAYVAKQNPASNEARWTADLDQTRICPVTEFPQYEVGVSEDDAGNLVLELYDADGERTGVAIWSEDGAKGRWTRIEYASDQRKAAKDFFRHILGVVQDSPMALGEAPATPVSQRMKRVAWIKF